MKYWPHFLFSLLLQYSSVCAQVPFAQSVDLNGSFQSTMCLVLVGLASISVLMLMLSLYLRHYTDCCGEGRTATDLCSGGFNRELINKCPVFPYSTIKDIKIGKETLECAVCLNEFEDEDKVRLLPKCNHVFHQNCIDAWLPSHMNCPVCRTKLTSGNDKDIAVSIDIPRTDESSQQSSSSSNSNVVLEEGQSSRSNVIGEEFEPDSDSTGVVQKVVISDARESRMLEKLQKSHSTGHSLEDRYTLRLPEHVVLPGAWSGNNVERWSLGYDGSERTRWTSVRMPVCTVQVPQEPSTTLPV